MLYTNILREPILGDDPFSTLILEGTKEEVTGREEVITYLYSLIPY